MKLLKVHWLLRYLYNIGYFVVINHKLLFCGWSHYIYVWLKQVFAILDQDEMRRQILLHSLMLLLIGGVAAISSFLQVSSCTGIYIYHLLGFHFTWYTRLSSVVFYYLNVFQGIKAVVFRTEVVVLVISCKTVTYRQFGHVTKVPCLELNVLRMVSHLNDLYFVHCYS